MEDIKMNKKEFTEKAKSTVDDILGQFDTLASKADRASDNAKAEIQKVISDLKTKKEDLKKKYEAMAKATDENWDAAKSDFSQSAGSFKEGLKKISSHMN